MAIDEGLEELTLSTLADGEVEAQFQERLHQGSEAMRAMIGRVAIGKDGSVTIKIPLEVTMQYFVHDKTWLVGGVALDIKRPKPIGHARPAYLRAGEFKQKPEIQPELPSDGNVTKLP